MQLDSLTPDKAAELSALVARFHRDMARQRRRDADTLASFMRAVMNPDNRADVDRLRQIIGANK
jgi:hypothetical protein